MSTVIATLAVSSLRCGHATWNGRCKDPLRAGIEGNSGTLDPRLEVNIPSTVEFVRTLTVDALPAQEFQEVLAYTMAVCPEVRLALLSRQIDRNDALAKIKVPVLIVQGERDQIPC